jgi:hypothetical protein
MMMALLACVGCEPKTKSALLNPDTPVQPPAYAQIAARYNARLEHLDTLWARANIKAFFRDEDGKFHTETGEDSILMFDRPDQVALCVGKLGKIGLWAGCNESTYWLFEVQEDKRVWYGSHANLGKPTTQPLPLPIHPLRLLTLLGVQPLPPEVSGDEAKASLVILDNGNIKIEPPSGDVRMWLDPATAAPKTIELLDANGQVVLTAHLSGVMPVRTMGLPEAQWPMLADRIEIYVAGKDGELTIKLNDATSGAGHEKAEKALKNAFNFALLVNALRPQSAVNLDQPQ